MSVGPVVLAAKAGNNPSGSIDPTNVEKSFRPVPSEPLTCGAAGAPNVVLKPFYHFAAGEKYFMYLTGQPPATAPGPAPAPGKPAKPVLRYAAGSTVKVEQLIGDGDKEQHRPTLSRTFTRFGVLGTDLGHSFEHEGHSYLLFGDTVGHVSWAEDTIATTDARDPEQGIRLDFLMASKGKYLLIKPPGISMGPLETSVGGISLGGRM